LSAEAHQVLSALLLKAEEPALAAIAAHQSVSAADRCGDELTRASSMGAIVHTLFSGGHPSRAATVATSAAERLADGTDMRDPAALSLYGAPFPRGAIAAARCGDRAQAGELLAEAARAASHVGRDANLHWTAFGPTNVATHQPAWAT
jgi:hypothetical protein